MSDVILREARYRRHSEKAVLVAWQGQELWLPFTQLRVVPREWENAPDSIPRGDDLAISEWIAREKGISASEATSADARSAAVNSPASEASGVPALRQEIVTLKKERSGLQLQLDTANKRANDAFMQVTALEQRMRVRDEELSKLRAKVGKQTGSAADIAAQPSQAQPVAAAIDDETREAHRFNLLETD